MKLIENGIIKTKHMKVTRILYETDTLCRFAFRFADEHSFW